MKYKAVNSILDFLDELGYKQVTIRGAYLANTPLCFMLKHKKNYNTKKTDFSIIDHDGIFFKEATESYSVGLNSCLVQWFNHHFAKYPDTQKALKFFSENLRYQGLIVFTREGYKLQYHPRHNMLEFLSDLGFEHQTLDYRPKEKKSALVLKQVHPVKNYHQALEV